MERPRCLGIVLFLLVAGLVPAFCLAQIEVTPATGWNVGTFGAAQLTGLPGTNFTSTQTSASNLLTINVTRWPTGDWSWRVDVSKADTTWNGAMTLWILRTGNGTGTGTGASISGGNVSFQQITGTATSFYTGRRDRTGVTAQLELRGLAVTVGPNAYSTTVTYTLVQL